MTLKLIRIMPPAITGLALGIASLGGLVEGLTEAESQAFATGFKHASGILSAILIILFSLRILFDFAELKAEFENNVLARAVAPTYFMTLMVLSTYLKSAVPTLALVLWSVALCIQLLWALAFLYKYVIREFEITNILPAWFVIAAGFVVGTTTSPVHGTLGVGKALFFAGLIGFYVLLPVFVYRMVRYFKFEKPVWPTLTITMAPANLLLAGHMSLVIAGAMKLNALIIHPLLCLSVLGVLFVLVFTIRYLFGEFMPTFSGFTFPFVITATALTALSEGPLPWLAIPALVMQLAAVFVVAYVTVRYLCYLGAKLFARSS